MFKRMELAKEALDIFIRSLPMGCTFSVISFGFRWKSLDFPKEHVTNIRLTDPSKEWATEKISQFTADYGGTNILDPLKAAQTQF